MEGQILNSCFRASRRKRLTEAWQRSYFLTPSESNGRTFLKSEPQLKSSDSHQLNWIDPIILDFDFIAVENGDFRRVNEFAFSLFPALLIRFEIDNDDSKLVIQRPARKVALQKSDRTITHPNDATTCFGRPRANKLKIKESHPPFVGTYDGAHVKLYVNGALIDSQPLTGAMSDYGRNLRIGAFSNLGGPSSVLPGLVDEVSIYDRALTPTEIQGIFNAGSAGKCSGAPSAPPTTVAAPNPTANAAGWNNSDVNVSFAATDSAGGTAIQEIVYSASGAQTIAATTVSGPTANVNITAEGETTVSYFARDVNGNTEEIKSLSVKIDKTAPVINVSRSPNSNGAGWNNSDVTANYTASDSLSGLNGTSQPSGSFVFATEGANQSHTFTVTDVAGNSSSATIENVNIDKSAPSVNCASADGAWHSADVSIACTAAENISALVNNTDANFTLVTNVAQGTETANAVSDSREVCDIAGNCTTAQPIGGNKVDKKATTITISTPSGGNYLLNQAVTVAYDCADGGSGVATCTGTPANGGLLDTASAGDKTFTVSATDNVGNTASPASANYTVIFGVVALYDQAKSHKLGSSMPIKIRLVDANGVNVSSTTTVVHAVSVIQIGSQASVTMDETGNSTSDLDFRYDGTMGGYIFNLSTKGYSTGTYQINFTAGNGPTIYAVRFQVRE